MRVQVTASYIARKIDLRGEVIDSKDAEHHSITEAEMIRMLDRGKAVEATESQKTTYPEQRTRSRVASMDTGGKKSTGGKKVDEDAKGGADGKDGDEGKDTKES